MPIVNPTAETHPERFGYRLPELQHVTYRTPDGKLLEANEVYRDKAIHQSAVILQRILGLADEWKDALPEALAATLDAHDSHAADAAAIAYLRRRGYTVGDKTEGY